MKFQCPANGRQDAHHQIDTYLQAIIVINAISAEISLNLFSCEFLADWPRKPFKFNNDYEDAEDYCLLICSLNRAIFSE